MLRTLFRNIISNWCGFAVQAIVAFFLTPFVLHSLGETRYGIWVLVISFTGYYGLLDLGFRAGITQYLTRHLATRDFEQMNRIASTSVAALAACGLMIVLIAGGLVWLAPKIFSIPLEHIAETRWCILIIGISSAISFTMFTFSAVFAATQRYDITNAISITIRLITAMGTVVALRQGYGLVGLSLLNAAGELLGYLLRMRIAYWVLPQLRISLGMAAWENLWSLTTYGVWSFLTQSAIQIRAYSSILVIGLFLPISALAPYSLANQVTMYFNMIFAPMAIVFFPAATQLDALGDSAGLRRMYLIGSRVMLAIAVAVGTIAAVWAEDFFHLWVGTRMAAGNEYPAVATLFQLLLVTTIVATGQKIGIQVFLASRRLRALTFLLAAEVAIGLILGICLIQYYGLLGVALGMMIPAVVFQGMMQPVLLCRFLNISAASYLLQVYARPVIVGVVLYPVLTIIHNMSPAINTWEILFLNGSIAGIAAVSVLAMFGLESGERRRFLVEPLRRIIVRMNFRIAQDKPMDRL